MEVTTAPIKALVYLEGPPVGIDILASCFSIAPSKPPEPVRYSVSCFVIALSFKIKFARISTYIRPL